mmetsp:Transcript_12502/g.34505  ORF Transcript_12502/g.34505 Transcript_12502/m.34505 type:complete len:237 (-) Transcript_12502:6543-7253(-)
MSHLAQPPDIAQKTRARASAMSLASAVAAFVAASLGFLLFLSDQMRDDLLNGDFRRWGLILRMIAGLRHLVGFLCKLKLKLFVQLLLDFKVGLALDPEGQSMLKDCQHPLIRRAVYQRRPGSEDELIARLPLNEFTASACVRLDEVINIERRFSFRARGFSRGGCPSCFQDSNARPPLTAVRVALVGVGRVTEASVLLLEISFLNNSAVSQELGITRVLYVIVGRGFHHLQVLLAV